MHNETGQNIIRGYGGTEKTGGCQEGLHKPGGIAGAAERRIYAVYEFSTVAGCNINTGNKPRDARNNRAFSSSDGQRTQ